MHGQMHGQAELLQLTAIMRDRRVLLRSALEGTVWIALTCRPMKADKAQAARS